MASKIKKRLQKIMQRKFFSSNHKNEEIHVKIASLTPEAIEQRRREAMEYLLRKYLENKRRQEELERKLSSYGPFRRWLYKRWRSLRFAALVFKEAIAKPVILSAAVCSAVFSIWLGTTLSPTIAKFTQTHVFHPFNYVIDLLILFPIGFFPALISITLSYFQEKRKLKRVMENYGMTF
ncbi:MAG: hypothetical protein QXY07_03890 [Candidatus Bathyarchaeia archaeon]